MGKAYRTCWVVIGILLVGCANLRPAQSYVDPALSDSEKQFLAQDILAYLTQALPPARTTLILDPPASQTPDALTSVLIPALRSQGYGLILNDSNTSQTEVEGIPLRYRVSHLSSGVVLRLGYLAQELSRYYPRDAQGQLQATLPFSLRESLP